MQALGFPRNLGGPVVSTCRRTGVGNPEINPWPLLGVLASAEEQTNRHMGGI